VSDWSYVITGWVATFVVLGGYVTWIAARLKRAKRSLDAEPPA
jgi:hypothetical protein